MLRESRRRKRRGRKTRSRGGEGLFYSQVGIPHLWKALHVKTTDFKRLYTTYTVEQNKSSYEEQFLQYNWRQASFFSTSIGFSLDACYF